MALSYNDGGHHDLGVGDGIKTKPSRKREEGKRVLNVTIPPNTTAEMRLYDTKPDTYKVILPEETNLSALKERGYLKFEVGSGS